VKVAEEQRLSLIVFLAATAICYNDRYCRRHLDDVKYAGTAHLRDRRLSAHLHGHVCNSVVLPDSELNNSMGLYCDMVAVLEYF
jgi:hypothetical protein